MYSKIVEGDQNIYYVSFLYKAKYALLRIAVPYFWSHTRTLLIVVYSTLLIEYRKCCIKKDLYKLI